MRDAAPNAVFERVFVEITTTCNLRCPFCAGTSRPSSRMTPDFFRHVLDQVRLVTSQISPHVLGEPLTHPDFPELLDLCAQAGLSVNLTTNGTLIHTTAGRAVLGSMVRQVNFSLQALLQGQEINMSALDAILDFVRSAIDIRPELYINLRLWNLSSLHDPEAPHDTILLSRIANALGTEVSPPPPGRKSRRLTGRVYLHQDTRFGWPGTSAPRTTGYCHALSSHCAVLVDGTICPCCLDAEGILGLGNLHQDDLAEILNNPRARAMREGFKKGQLVESLCQACDYCRRFSKLR